MGRPRFRAGPLRIGCRALAECKCHAQRTRSEGCPYQPGTSCHGSPAFIFEFSRWLLYSGLQPSLFVFFRKYLSDFSFPILNVPALWITPKESAVLCFLPYPEISVVSMTCTGDPKMAASYVRPTLVSFLHFQHWVPWPPLMVLHFVCSFVLLMIWNFSYDKGVLPPENTLSVPVNVSFLNIVLLLHADTL